MTFEGHFGDQLSNFLVPLNIFGTDEATHLKIGRQIALSSASQQSQTGVRAASRGLSAIAELRVLKNIVSSSL